MYDIHTQRIHPAKNKKISGKSVFIRLFLFFWKTSGNMSRHFGRYPANVGRYLAILEDIRQNVAANGEDRQNFRRYPAKSFFRRYLVKCCLYR